MCSAVLVTGCGGIGATRGDDRPGTTTPNAGAGSEGGTGNDGGTGGDAGGAAGDDHGAALPITGEDISRITGTSFDTPPSVSNGCTAYAPELSPDIDFLQLTFVDDQEGGIEAIASTRGPWLEIRRSALVKTRAGWKVEPPPPTAGCMARAFEEEVEPYWPTPNEIVIDFDDRDDEDGKVTSFSLTARFDGAGGEGGADHTLTTTGKRDETAPFIAEDEYEYDSMYDVYYRREEALAARGLALPRHFNFSEALPPGWSIALENDAGLRFEVAHGESGALDTGFSVTRYFPPGFHWVVRGTDFAGNAFTPSAYPSSLPEPVDGGFESEATLDSLLGCNDTFGERAIAAVPPEFEGVPALSGTSSLFFRDCPISMLVSHPSGTSTLRAQVRLLQNDPGQLADLRVELRSLAPGEDSQWAGTLSEFTLDPSFSSTNASVSSVTEIGIPLLADTSDFLLTLSSNAAVWLDSVRAE